MVENENNYLVPVDYYGDISSNEQGEFWFPKGKGTLFLYGESIRYKNISDTIDTIDINFNKIIKVKMISLNPNSNPWTNRIWSSPYYLLFWIPFWNRYLINLTYLDNSGKPRELFFKLKTEKNTIKTMSILREKLKHSLKGW